MDSPRLGLRRARVTSWVMIGMGITGVAGASALAYTDTVKPAVADELPDASVAESGAQIPSFVESPAPAQAPDVTTTAVAPPPPPSPATTAPPAPEYTPRYTPDYTPSPTADQAPSVVRQAPTTQPKAPPTTKRRSLTPTTVMAPNYSPHVTISRGS